MLWAGIDGGMGKESDDEGHEEEEVEGKGIRLFLEKDDVIIKKMVDPLLPSEDEVKSHSLQGHIPY